MKTADAPPAVEAEVPLVFQWERRTRIRWHLAWLVALSLLIHAVGFYVLQVSYTPTGSQLPPPVQVMMVRPARADDPPEMRAQSLALAQWLTVTDPSLATQPAVPEAERDPVGFVRYIPSYKAAPPPFKPLDPPPTGNTAPPRPLPPGPVPILSATTRAQTVSPSPLTRVILSGALASAVPIPLPAVAFSLPTKAKTLSPTVFLVGVRPEGGRPFLFRQATSGELNADDYAQDYLARLHFQPLASSNDTTAWGWVEFDWGRDIYR